MLGRIEVFVRIIKPENIRKILGIPRMYKYIINNNGLFGTTGIHTFTN